MNIFITGAESTGKSVLTELLSKHFDVPFLPEFAREYISSLNRPYDINDLEIIGKKQIAQIQEYKSKNLVLFDTGLVITYVWYEVKYEFVPGWLKQALAIDGMGKYLVCETDLPWEPDPLRENPTIREELNLRYKEIIRDVGFEWELVKGSGKERFAQAVRIIEDWIPDKGIK